MRVALTQAHVPPHLLRRALTRLGRGPPAVAVAPARSHTGYFRLHPGGRGAWASTRIYLTLHPSPIRSPTTDHRPPTTTY